MRESLLRSLINPHDLQRGEKLELLHDVHMRRRQSISMQPETVTSVARPQSGAERRREQRICEPFPARVKGVDVNGASFEVDTAIDNISVGCLYLRLVPCVKEGTKLSVIFRLSTAVDNLASAARVEVKGEVLRMDAKIGGVCGVAIGYKLRRFYYAGV